MFFVRFQTWWLKKEKNAGKIETLKVDRVGREKGKFPVFESAFCILVCICEQHLYWLTLSQGCPVKTVVRLTDLVDMTIAVEWDVKPLTNQLSKSFEPCIYTLA